MINIAWTSCHVYCANKDCVVRGGKFKPSLKAECETAENEIVIRCCDHEKVKG